MAAAQTDKLLRDRPRRSWLKLVGIVFAIILLYVASIGPLAALEARGYGSNPFWRGIKSAYYPVFWSWKHGPKWWAVSLRSYTRLFHAPHGCSGMAIYYFASENDADAYRFYRRMFESDGTIDSFERRQLKRLDSGVGVP